MTSPLPLPLISTFLVLLPPDCKFNCHKRCATRVPNDCLGEALINGGKKLGVLSERATRLGGGPSDFPVPPDVPMEEATDFSEADKSSLTDEPDDSGFIPGSHSENALHASEEEEGEGGKSERYPGPHPAKALPHPYRGLTSPCTFLFPGFLRPVAGVASNPVWWTQGE